MLRIIFKRFSDNTKIVDAKKKAMEMYERMRNEEKVPFNRKLEEELILKDKDKIQNKDVNNYKSDESKMKIEEIFDKFEFIEKSKIKENSVSQPSVRNRKQNNSTSRINDDLNLNYYNKIENEELLYKLSEIQKSGIDADKWVKIYEAKFDPNYERLINFLLKLCKIIIFYKTLFYIKRYFWNGNKEEPASKNKIKIKDIAYMSIFYFFTLGFYFMNTGFNKRNMTKMLVKGNTVRVFLYNINKTKQNTNFSEIPIERLISITSKSKTLHEIFYFNQKNKLNQLFAYKNAFYDKNFLVNLCHPKVKKVRFTNINLE